MLLITIVGEARSCLDIRYKKAIGIKEVIVSHEIHERSGGCCIKIEVAVHIAGYAGKFAWMIEKARLKEV